MTQELNRNFTVLKEKADPPPYFLSYEVTEVEYGSVSGTLGTITSNTGGKSRALDVSVRVGSPKLDNYRRIRGDRGQFTSGALLSFEDEPNAIKRRLWLETDRAYRTAAERFIRIKTNTQVKVAAEDNSDDFSIEKPAKSEGAPPHLEFDSAAWQSRVRKLSDRFRNYPSVLTSHVTMSAQTGCSMAADTRASRSRHRPKRRTART
jgi:hypothetical protein